MGSHPLGGGRIYADFKQVYACLRVILETAEARIEVNEARKVSYMPDCSPGEKVSLEIVAKVGRREWKDQSRGREKWLNW